MQPTVTTEVQTPPILAHVFLAGCPSGDKETSLNTADSAMAHNARATETTLTALSTACVDSTSIARKKTAQDILTIAPSEPPD